MTWTPLNLRLTQGGLELHAPDLGLTVLIKPPKKTRPTLPPSAPAIDTAGELVSDNVVPFARRVA